MVLQVGSIAGLSAKKPSSKIGKLAIDTVLQIAAENANTESRWHHAGDTIRHVCPDMLLHLPLMQDLVAEEGLIRGIKG